MEPERTCPKCSYRTTLPVADLCPVCSVPLVLQERTWVPTRRAPRTVLHSPVIGRLDGRIGATILDLSILGARVEHGEPLRQGWRYILAVSLREGALPIHLPLRIVWSRAERTEQRLGKAELIYQSGVEFQGLAAEDQQALAAFLGGLGGTCPGPLPATVASPRD